MSDNNQTENNYDWEAFWQRLKKPLESRWVHLAELPDDNDADRGCSQYHHDYSAALGQFSIATDAAHDADDEHLQAFRDACEMMFQAGAEFAESTLSRSRTAKGRQKQQQTLLDRMKKVFDIFDEGIVNSEDIAAEMFERHGEDLNERTVRRYLKDR